LKINQIIIKISKKYFRPNEVENLIGNTSKAKKTFKWKPKIKIDELIKEMLESDLKI
jgi:GDPmannose 4,6-dehydratase